MIFIIYFSQKIPLTNDWYSLDRECIVRYFLSIVWLCSEWVSSISSECLKLTMILQKKMLPNLSACSLFTWQTAFLLQPPDSFFFNNSCSYSVVGTTRNLEIFSNLFYFVTFSYRNPLFRLLFSISNSLCRESSSRLEVFRFSSPIRFESDDILIFLSFI